MSNTDPAPEAINLKPGIAQAVDVVEARKAAIGDGAEVRRLLPQRTLRTIGQYAERGQTSSLKSGLTALPDRTEAFLLYPVDFPLVSAAELRLLLDPLPGMSDNLSERVSNRLNDRLLLRVPCEVVESGSLPRFELKARRVVRLD